MFIRGTNTKIPLEFVRVQPYVSPKIELSNAAAGEGRSARLARHLPFRAAARASQVYPGELVDVYVGEK